MMTRWNIQDAPVYLYEFFIWKQLIYSFAKEYCEVILKGKGKTTAIKPHVPAKFF